MSIGWYNGWSPEERLATLVPQREALSDGRLVRPTCCSLCGSNVQVWFHNERYDDPLNVYPLCRSCHRCLHERFDDPQAWLKRIERHGNSQGWFTLLTMDGASLYRPFAETYPVDLPRWDE